MKLQLNSDEQRVQESHLSASKGKAADPAV
jgi:hypothetical protein